MGWLSYQDNKSFIVRKLKCGVCDSEGNAHVQDIIDFYEYISDKAPEHDKVKRWKAYHKLANVEGSDTENSPKPTEG